MYTTITNVLTGIEMTEGIKILYACESGSRAWGFESPNSDYDVRCIYVRPLSWYLGIQKRRDVLEYPINSAKMLNPYLDISGWDLRKALFLMASSNPPLLEWLGSPIVYRETPATTELRTLAQMFYCPNSCAYHYLSLARNCWKEYLVHSVVSSKKYLYALRAILALSWIEQGLGVVPTEFGVLVNQIIAEPVLRQAVDDLLAQKMSGAEMGKGPRIEVISRFLESELDRQGRGQFAYNKTTPRSTEALDQMFMRTVLGQ